MRQITSIQPFRIIGRILFNGLNTDYIITSIPVIISNGVSQLGNGQINRSDNNRGVTNNLK